MYRPSLQVWGWGGGGVGDINGMFLNDLEISDLLNVNLSSFLILG